MDQTDKDEDKRRRDWEAARAKEKADADQRAREDAAGKAEADKFQEAKAKDAAEAKKRDLIAGREAQAAKNRTPEAMADAAERKASEARPSMAPAKRPAKAAAYLVDIKENPGVLGSILVEATAPDGTVESATFSGPRAPERAMKYVEAMEGFERRPPAEYPKYVRRGGVEHLILDAEHEKQIGPPTDADRAADEARAKAREEAHGRHAAFDEAQVRVAQDQTLPAPRPERLGESDEAYAARLEQWQATRRGTVAPKDFGVVGDGSAASPASPASLEAQRLRDIAARRREPRIENIPEPAPVLDEDA